jgi:hypothetical protein
MGQVAPFLDKDEKDQNFLEGASAAKRTQKITGMT